MRAAFHDWRDALAVAIGAASVTGIRRRVFRDPAVLVWRIGEVTSLTARFPHEVTVTREQLGAPS